MPSPPVLREDEERECTGYSHPPMLSSPASQLDIKRTCPYAIRFSRVQSLGTIRCFVLGSDSLDEIFHSPTVFRMNYEEMEREFKNAVRLLCSSSYDSKYIRHKDIAFQQIKELSLPSDGDKRTVIILPDYYDLPFSDILDWNKISVIVKEDDVPHLKKILEGTPEGKFKKMRQNVIKEPLQSYAKHSDIFAELFHMPEDFIMDYVEMEKNFKIFVYPHNTSLRDKPKKLDGEYESEGLFFENLDKSRFLTKDLDKARLFLYCSFLDLFFSDMILGRSEDERAIAVEDFVNSLISNYPYWNPTLGTYRFFINCVDIHVTATPFNVSAAGNDTRERNTLAFWIGQPDSYIREKLVNSWGFDREFNIQKGLEASTIKGRWACHGNVSMSKFCICPGGPRLDGVIAVAINCGCVLVILSEYYDLPFNDILDWKKFSVRKHFQWNLSPLQLDALHMVMYELCLRRHFTKYCGVSKS
ncbi:unnamed protein product [Dovyalis caffra]|uniref:Exostosin GT47 domain-containing protein n=1 Tax=Dovyalis caffra TaxID=77055 RepID=A0AAV1SRB1_9ROSI|nr:unnamed protein product [Dovyalis caffra]